jgi:hypothetical protein
MILSTLLEGYYAFSELAILYIKRFRNCSNDELYIQFTWDTSIIVKYKAAPRMATGLY